MCLRLLYYRITPNKYFLLQNEPDVKMLVLLGEVGGTEEYKVCEALKRGASNKPLVAWCIGTCADMFATEVQVGEREGRAREGRKFKGNWPAYTCRIDFFYP